MTADHTEDGFDEVFDIVVVGFGFAGAACAIEAADHGASVLLIEKMEDPGGISITAGGGIRWARDADEAFTYLNHTNDGRTSEDVLRVFAEGMTRIPEYFQRLSKINDAELKLRDREGNYPFPGYKTFGYLEVEYIPGFDLASEYPQVRGRLGGPRVFKIMHDHVRARPIDVRCDCAADRLITGQGNEVIGVRLNDSGTDKSVKARKAVVLCCGGFEANTEMQTQYWQLRPLLSAACRGNTGDGIRMAQSVGADLWHMWHFHGSYGFRHPDPDYAGGIRMKRLPDWTPGGSPMDVQMSWITVDQNARRYANECVPYTQDTGWREMDMFNPINQRFDRIPSCIIVDEEGRKIYPLGQFVYNDRHASPYDWSDDNLKEVENGILKKASSIGELATALKLDPIELERTVDRWNAACDAGFDDDFGRPPKSMMPVRTPPFYGGVVWPIISNTQGGPVHDAQQRVLNPYGEPIPRLFEAGECGSIWGYLYMAGGNLSECFIGGQIAGREAAALAPWDQ